MRDNAEIELRWKTKDNKSKKIIIKPGSPVKAIVLNGPAIPFAAVPEPFRSSELADVDAGDGPLVCYLIGGELQCW